VQSSHMSKLAVAVGASIGLVGLAFAPTAHAAITPVTFAQFEQAGASSNSFAYVDNGGLTPGTGLPGGSTPDAQFLTSGAGGLGAAIPVTFQYLSLASLPADLQGPLSATLALTSATTSPVIPLGGVIDDQNITGDGSITDTLSITLDSPAAEGSGSKTNLLTVVFTGQLVGEGGSRTPQLSGNTALGDSVTFSSDFLTFDAAQARDFSLTFTSWTTGADSGGLEVDPLDSFYQSATAAGTGTFDATIIPEPSTIAILALGSFGLLSRRRLA
jgi:PEP-CTERM motif